MVFLQWSKAWVDRRLATHRMDERIDVRRARRQSREQTTKSEEPEQELEHRCLLAL
ncbi:UNVERIFIED_ORG: hypothetical protein BDU10_2298 [Burkholderia sp. CF145]|nr:hypothetical protein SAMN05445504_0729 [Burkholderia sp. CF099]